MAPPRTLSAEEDAISAMPTTLVRVQLVATQEAGDISVRARISPAPETRRGRLTLVLAILAIFVAPLGRAALLRPVGSGVAAVCNLLHTNRWTARKCAYIAALLAGTSSARAAASPPPPPPPAHGGVQPPADWSAPLPGTPSVGYEWPPLLRGAHPHSDARVRAAGGHRCDSDALELPLSALNDGWCDCADGTDEPGTPACAGAGSRFWCAAAGGALPPVSGEWIDAGLVDDGVCDCCDGSDEPAGVGCAARAGCAAGQATVHGAAPAFSGGGAAALEATALAVHEMRVRAALTVRHFREEAAGLSDFFARVRAKVDAGAAMGANGVPSRAKLTEMHQHYQSVATLLHHGFDDPLAPAADEYAAVFQECVEATLCAGPCSSHAERAQQYVWRMCPFVHATQAPADGRGRATLLGTWKGWGSMTAPSLVASAANVTDARPLWIFDEGEACWEGPQRHVIVELRCGPRNALVAVDEDGKCRYLMLYETPAACRLPYGPEEAEALERGVAAAAAAAAQEQEAAEAAAAAAASEAAAAAAAASARAGGEGGGRAKKRGGTKSGGRKRKPAVGEEGGRLKR